MATILPYESIESRAKDFYAMDYDASGWASMPVPGMWELNGYGDPVYKNIGYAWHGHYRNNPPLPADWHNYAGQYRRTFTLTDEWKGKDVFLHIGSATSNVRVWVNGREVGYSEDSKLEARFNITKLGTLYKMDEALLAEITAGLKEQILCQAPDDLSKSCYGHEVSEESIRQQKRLLCILFILAGTVVLLIAAGIIFLVMLFLRPPDPALKAPFDQKMLLDIQPKVKLNVTPLPMVED